MVITKMILQRFMIFCKGVFIMNTSKNRLTSFFAGMPSYNNDKDYAAFASLTAPLNMFFLICLVLHTGYLMVFSLFHYNIVVVFELVGIVFYATFVILLKHFKGSWLPCTLLTIGELFLHQLCCVALFGLDPGFHYLMIPLMFLSVFIGTKRSRMVLLARSFITVLASVTFIFLLVYFNDYRPPYELPHMVGSGMLIVNCVTSFLATAIYTGRVVNSIDTKRSELDSSVDEKIAAIEQMQNRIIISFANIIEARDGNTGKHVIRTSEYVQALVLELKKRGEFEDILTERYMQNTILSAPLHDIGKITVPDAILLKPGKLTEEEFKQIKNHTINGKKLIEGAMADIEDADFINVAKSVALYHHECWNGEGYPYGIRGEDIPLCARIMTIADVFDALAAKRVYKAAMPIADVFDIIRSERGKKFDPIVTDAFLAIQDEITEIASAKAD